MRAIGITVLAVCVLVMGNASAKDQNSGGYMPLSADQSAQQTKGLPKPGYPFEFRKRNLEATMTLRLFVSASGKIDRVEAIRSQGAPELVNFAVSFVKQNWRFAPFINEGQPTPVWLDTPMYFILVPSQPVSR